MKAKSLVGIAISLILLWLFFRNQEWDKLRDSLLDVQPLWIVPGIVVYFAGIWLRGIRWRLLMLPFAKVPDSRLASVILIGFTVNNVLPLRLGELVRTFVLRRSHGVPIPATLATILIERVLDMVALCGLMTLVYAIERDRISGWVEYGSYFCIAVTAGGVVGLLVLLATPRRWLDALLELATRIAARVHHKLGEVVASCVDGVRALEDTRSLLGVVSLSILCWVAELGIYYFMMLTVGMNTTIWALVAGMVVANLATVFPSSPGYVGTFDVLLKDLLQTTFGVAEPIAVTYTLLTHAVLLLPVVFVGFLMLSREDLSIRGLAHGRVEGRALDAEALETPTPAVRSARSVQPGTDAG
ncbi:MAG: lysylphosphatidylglycerol synthase transmembrane domain-containing protein [Chloroflexota bacterium]